MRLDQALCSIKSPHNGYYYLTLRTVWDTQSRWRVFGRQGSATTARAHHKCQTYEGGGEEEEEATAAAATAGQHRLCQWPQERSA